MRRAFSSDENAPASEDLGVERGSKEMLHARRELKSAIGAAAETAQEQERILEILRRAAEEIRNKPPSDS
jgi:hypothetical protein